MHMKPRAIEKVSDGPSIYIAFKVVDNYGLRPRLSDVA